MFEIVPFEPAHLKPLLNQKTNLWLTDFFLSGGAKAVTNQGSVTGMLDGVPMACGGVLPYWEGRGQVWTVFNEESKANFVPVFRAIRKYLSDQLKIYRRIEVCIPCGFQLGKRRAEMLGFKLECERARSYLPNGDDCTLYSMVRE